MTTEQYKGVFIKIPESLWIKYKDHCGKKQLSLQCSIKILISNELCDNKLEGQHEDLKHIPTKHKNRRS